MMTGRLSCSASLATCLSLLRLGARPQVALYRNCEISSTFFVHSTRGFAASLNRAPTVGFHCKNHYVMTLGPWGSGDEGYERGRYCLRQPGAGPRGLLQGRAGEPAGP